MASHNNGEDSKKAVPMDPQLLMAARRGDRQLLENLLVNKVGKNVSQIGSNFVIRIPEMTSSTDATKEEEEEEEAAAAAAADHQPHKGTEQFADDSGNEIHVAHAQQRSSVALLPLEKTTLAESQHSQHSSILEGVTHSEEDSAIHVVAASGDSNQYLLCAELIYGKAAHLLDAVNGNGDTPLHSAARAGNLNMVTLLMEMATRDSSNPCDVNNKRTSTEFLRKMNKHGETALHGAVRSTNTKLIEKLISEDPGLVQIPSNGISPLYLAVSLGYLHIATDFIQTSRNKRLSYSGPDGRNVLHVAVFQGTQALSKLLQLCKDVDVNIQQGNQTQRVPLLLQLSSQQDINGSTPLHFAASLETNKSTGLSSWSEYLLPYLFYLRIWFEYLWPKQKTCPAKQLLECNEYAMYQPDGKGSYPIHVAACSGTLKVVTMFLTSYPDCATLRDTQGRTFLHVAVEKMRYHVVAFVCVRPEFSSILNMQDRNGNTPLHIAVQVGNLWIFNCLFRNRHVCLDLPNQHGLTPRDISWIAIPPRIYNKKNPRYMIFRSLAYARAAVSHTRVDHFDEKYAKRRDEDMDAEDIANASQIVGISSVLVATVTFAAAFTLPGGYRADDHENHEKRGTPTLAGRYAFDAFVISDTLAFVCSLMSSICLLYSGVHSRDMSTRRRHHGVSRILLQSSARSLVAAFAMGVYLVLAPVDPKMAASVCIISFASLLYGNTGMLLFLTQANTLRIRFGIMAARSQVIPILTVIVKKFWSYFIIFGLPAIIKIYRTS